MTHFEPVRGAGAGHVEGSKLGLEALRALAQFPGHLCRLLGVVGQAGTSLASHLRVDAGRIQK